MDSLHSSRVSTRWGYSVEQLENEQAINRTNTIYYKWIPLSEYCRVHKINYEKTLKRKNIWWTLEEAIEGKERYARLKKSIVQSDMNWNFIKKFGSISDAHRETWISLWPLSSALNWTYKYAWWYKWAYA